RLRSHRLPQTRSRREGCQKLVCCPPTHPPSLATSSRPSDKVCTNWDMWKVAISALRIGGPTAGLINSQVLRRSSLEIRWISLSLRAGVNPCSPPKPPPQNCRSSSLISVIQLHSGLSQAWHAQGETSQASAI